MDKVGWLGLWIGLQGREIFKTLTSSWAESEKDKTDTILQKFWDFVRPKKNKRVARFRLRQRKQRGCEAFDNFLKDIRL